MKILRSALSVRSVLTIWYALILLAAFLLFGAAVYVYLSHLQDQALRRDLREEVDWISRLVDIDRNRIAGGLPLEALSGDVERRITEHYLLNPRNYVVVLTSSRGTVLYESGTGKDRGPSGRVIPQGETVLLTLNNTNGATMRVAARRDDPFIIEVGYPEALGEAALGHLLTIFGILAPVVLFVAVSGGWLMAGMVLRPIREIAERAKHITASNLSGRITTRSAHDELAELIATINGMIARLEQSFQRMREFSLSIAHELKTPLTILRGEAELALAKPLTPAEAQDLASTYLEETSRLSRIVDDLLTLASGEEARLSMRSEPVNVERLLAEIHEDALILAADRGIAVTLELNEPALIAGDPVRLRQLLRALLSNAVRYTDPGGTIAIRSCREEGGVAIAVEDSGIGIPPESLGRIFDPFYRVDEARSRARGGSGLGLAVAKWIAGAHRGTIEVRSTPGQGSCFTVHLPAS